MKSNRLVFFAFLFVSYLSGFIPIPVNEKLLFRNISSVQGSTVSNQETAQVRELDIEVKEADFPPPAEQSVEEWGISKQIGEHTWSIKVGEDKTAGTTQDILVALNNYRQRHGKGTLSWDQSLANFAQSRADYFASRADLDSHAGFSDYINNQDGFNKLGFMSLGENSSLGYSLEGVHLIEWVYAGDKPHDDNQLNSEWTHVGIGVSATATDLIFGGKKM